MRHTLFVVKCKGRNLAGSWAALAASLQITAAPARPERRAS